jgi:iron(III) transport system ATP-binding protein
VQLTTVYVTHDQLEALALSDRIAVMNGGRIAQLGHPREIYESPADPFVADFIGTSSFLRGCVEMRTAGSGEVSISVAGGTTMTASTSRDFTPGTPVVVALRPERLRIMATPEQVPGESGTLLPAKVVSKSYLGARCQYELEMSDIVAKVESADEIDGSEVLVWIPAHGCTVFERSRDSETAPPPKRAAS